MLTDNEIIKALEYRLKVDGGTRIDKEALDLINRKKEEIERLEQNLEEAHIDIREHMAEIERLERECFTYKIRWAKATAKLEKTKAEAYKEFAERLRQFFCSKS